MGVVDERIVVVVVAEVESNVVKGPEREWVPEEVDSTRRQKAGVVDKLRNDYSGMPS